MSLLISGASVAQQRANYNEAKIKPYVLPDVLQSANGQKVKSIADWENGRRKEILRLFENEVYGKVPEIEQMKHSSQVIEESSEALNGKATRKQIALNFRNHDKEINILILLYTPNDVEYPPTFIGYNFYGNHTITEEAAVLLTDSWVANNEDFGITENKATEASRGVRTSRWPIEKIIEAGFGLATIYYGDVDPDRDNFSDGIHPLYYKEDQEKPKSDEWGAIAGWAWGASRVLDYLKQDHHTSGSKFIMFGHSRLGKAALWAGATDTRFDAVISNESGCGGAALSRRKFGETVSVINTSFPHWFADNFEKYNNKEQELPVDQHMLISLMAPRPVYLASAEGDQWADPKGEYLSGYYASPVYKLYSKEGFTSPEHPKVNQLVHNTIGYHMRPGKHDVVDYDWEQFMKFCKMNLSE